MEDNICKTVQREKEKKIKHLFEVLNLQQMGIIINTNWPVGFAGWGEQQSGDRGQENEMRRIFQINSCSFSSSQKEKKQQQQPWNSRPSSSVFRSSEVEVVSAAQTIEERREPKAF